MPIYEYDCSACGRRTEAIQNVGEKHLKICPHCGGALKKAFSAPAIQFRGSGFYITDYARGKKEESGTSRKSGESGEGSGSEKGESGSQKAEASDKAETREKTEKKEKAEAREKSESKSESKDKGGKKTKTET